MVDPGSVQVIKMPETQGAYRVVFTSKDGFRRQIFQVGRDGREIQKFGLYADETLIYRVTFLGHKRLDLEGHERLFPTYMKFEHPGKEIRVVLEWKESSLLSNPDLGPETFVLDPPSRVKRIPIGG